jgi:hypothetical protein
MFLSSGRFSEWDCSLRRLGRSERQRHAGVGPAGSSWIRCAVSVPRLTASCPSPGLAAAFVFTDRIRRPGSLLVGLIIRWGMLVQFIGFASAITFAVPKYSRQITTLPAMRWLPVDSALSSLSTAVCTAVLLISKRSTTSFVVLLALWWCCSFRPSPLLRMNRRPLFAGVTIQSRWDRTLPRQVSTRPWASSSLRCLALGRVVSWAPRRRR